MLGVVDPHRKLAAMETEVDVCDLSPPEVPSGAYRAPELETFISSPFVQISFFSLTLRWLLAAQGCRDVALVLS